VNNIEKADAEFQAIERAETAEQRGKRQVWERQAGESSKAFAAFARYRDLAEARTMAKVAEMSGCSSQNIERWARRWAWTHRVYEYDIVQEERFREQTAKDRLAHHRRQIQIGQHLQSVAIAGLAEWEARIEQKLPLSLSPEQVATLLKLGDELEAKGLGEERQGGQFTKIVVRIGESTFEEDYARQYAELDDAEKAAMDSWKDPPRERLN
jgi:hypothetical protein